MNEIELTEKDYDKIREIAVSDFMNTSFYRGVLEKITVEILIKAVLKFFSTSNLILAKGKVYKVDKDKYEAEFKALYEELDSTSKYEYVIKRDKVMLLHKIERLEKDLQRSNKELGKLKKEKRQWS